MPRFFNTAGTCLPDEHYMLPPEPRLGEVRGLIDQGLFFVIHAPRQTGKTTFLNSLARSLNREGRYTAVVMSVEYLRRTTDVVQGNLSLIRGLLEDSQRSVPPAEQPPDPAGSVEDPLRAFNDYLSAWAAACPKPIVLLIDEIDSLPEDLMRSIVPSGWPRDSHGASTPSRSTSSARWYQIGHSRSPQRTWMLHVRR